MSYLDHDNPREMLAALLEEIKQYSQTELGKLAGCGGRCAMCGVADCTLGKQRAMLFSEVYKEPQHRPLWDTQSRGKIAPLRIRRG